MKYFFENNETCLVMEDTLETYHFNPNNETCIFYIDDNEVDRWLVQNRIKDSELCGVLITVSNGEEGLIAIEEYYQKNRKLPNAIIVDLQMPAMDGFKLITAIKNLPYYSGQNCKLILTSVDLVEEDWVKIKELQIRNILIKPIELAELMKLL
jgi:CheY-like chemotaxis protein